MSDKVEVKYKPEDFIKEYEALCKKYGYRLVITPVWVARDDGTWSTRLQINVEALPKQG